MSAWDSRTQKLLDALARPFRKDGGGLLGKLFSALGREFSDATETVTVASDTDVRGDGSWSVRIRQDSLTAVTSVRRVDAGGATLETYTVVSFDDRTIKLSGTKAPGAGDRLQLSYSYQFSGMEARIKQALLQLNILTAAGAFLDAWGRWFGVPRQTTGTYGSFHYGQQLYGTAGAEADTQYSRRIIDRVKQHRNTKTAILEAVRRVTGGNPYIVEWFDGGGGTGFVFRPSGTDPWTGEADTRKHLVWGQSSRFLSSTVAGGGACVIEVWIPQGTGFSTEQVRQIANQYKAAGIRVFVRYQPPAAPSDLTAAAVAGPEIDLTWSSP